MGFFGINPVTTGKAAVGGVSLEFMHRHECNACPMHRAAGLRHPYMKPTGSEHPLVYIIGEAPGETEDRRGIQFVGKAGEVLKFRIPEQWLSKLRYNNVIRCRPPNNRDPAYAEIECCRPSIVRDIEQTQPQAIFGFGAVPLHWATGQSTITNWNGRRIPVKIGSHSCWFFPMLHPSFVARTRRFDPKSKTQFGSDLEIAFAHDLRRAFAAVEEGLPEPIVHTEKQALEGIEIITGHDGVRDLDRLGDLLHETAKQDLVGLDYETKGLRPYHHASRLLTASLSTEVSTFAFALDHPKSGWTESQRDRAFELFEEFLKNAPCERVAHNLAFEAEWSSYWFGRQCLRSKAPWHDTQSQAYILDERQGHGKCLSLKFLTVQNFGFDVKALFELDKNNMDQEPIDQVLRYNCPDSRYARLLHYEQMERLRKEGLEEVYEHQRRRIPTLVLTQIKGVPVDQDVVSEFDRNYRDQLKELEADLASIPEVIKFRRMTQQEFRPSANKDVIYILRNILGKPVENTDKKVLEGINHPFCQKLLQWRGVSKLHSVYVKPLMAGSDILYDDGRIHPTFGTTSTSTWRTSSDDPNAQNFPKRKNKEVRQQIRHPNPDIKVVSFDFGGIQARNVAMESEDKKLVHYFNTWYDVHIDWMERIIRRYPKWIAEGVQKLRGDKDLLKHYRYRAKNQFVFPSFFGSSSKSVARDLGLPEEVAVALHEEFWGEFPDVEGWHKSCVSDYRKLGYVTGKSGFRRRAPLSQNELINAPIQGDEAKIVLGAMIRLSEMQDWRLQANLEVHDDLTFFWPKKDIERNSEVVIREMCRIEYDWINVPLVVEASVGDDWANLEDFGVFESVGRDSFREVKK